MYRGRFAPTPSGPLHLGSLLTALASWLQARRQGGAWFIRIDDLDRPRCMPGADGEILRQLTAHGLAWDGEPLRQVEHLPRYREAIGRLEAAGLAYRCACTRQLLREAQRAGPEGPVYPGTCRGAGHARGSLRARLPERPVILLDSGQRLERQAEAIGDPVVERSDGTPGYALASAMDEQALGITEVVRGGDLLGASFQQQALRPLLGLPSPTHRHLPVLTDAAGRKLSKQNRAQSVDTTRAVSNLRQCLEYLGQEAAQGSEPRELLVRAADRWRPELIPTRSTITV